MIYLQEKSIGSKIAKDKLPVPNDELEKMMQETTTDVRLKVEEKVYDAVEIPKEK